MRHLCELDSWCQFVGFETKKVNFVWQVSWSTSLCYQVIAESLSEEEIAGLREMFKAMDTDSSGAITFDELKAGLRRYGSTLKESEIRDLMDAVRCCYQVDIILFWFMCLFPSLISFFFIFIDFFLYLFILPSLFFHWIFVFPLPDVVSL